MHATTTRITMNKNKCKYTECESLRYTYETCAKEKRKKKRRKENTVLSVLINSSQLPFCEMTSRFKISEIFK